MCFIAFLCYNFSKSFEGVHEVPPPPPLPPTPCASMPFEHRCTPVENPGEGLAQEFWQKNPLRVRGFKGFRKNCRGWGSPFFGYYCIFINEFKGSSRDLVARAEDSRPRGHGFSFY